MPGQKVLLVEGRDDEHVLKHICTKRCIGRLDRVIRPGSYGEVLEAIPVQAQFLRGRNDAMGVVIDADLKLNNRWQAVRGRFSKAGYSGVPKQPDPSGTILYPPDQTFLPKAGVWIMPNNQSPGILEDFLAFLVPSNDAQWQHAQSCVNSITSPAFKSQDRPKAVIHTWLAWRESPGLPFGTAITARYLESDVPEVDELAGWLQRLFG